MTITLFALFAYFLLCFLAGYILARPRGAPCSLSITYRDGEVSQTLSAEGDDPDEVQASMRALIDRSTVFHDDPML